MDHLSPDQNSRQFDLQFADAEEEREGRAIMKPDAEDASSNETVRN